MNPNPPVVTSNPWLRVVLLIIAVLLFLLATFHAPVPTVDLVPLGLAFGFGAWLVP